MKIFFIMSPYWTGNGRSSPNWCLISAMTCGLGFLPAICLAGSMPGVLKKMTNTSTVIANITSTVHMIRLTMKVSTSPPPAASRAGRARP